MSDEARYGPYQIVVDGNMNANITSAVIIKVPISRLNFQVTWSGTSPVGTIQVQTSIDYLQNVDGTVRRAGSWNAMPFLLSTGALVTSLSVSGNTGIGTVDLESGAYAIRVLYTRTSGTGTMQVWAHGME
jgi:hypothetical protein